MHASFCDKKDTFQSQNHPYINMNMIQLMTNSANWAIAFSASQNDTNLPFIKFQILINHIFITTCFIVTRILSIWHTDIVM